MKKYYLIFLCLIFSTMAWSQNIVVIANVANSLSQISKDQIQDFYFKKNRQWPDGKAVRFFDRMDNSPIRSIFLQNIIQKTSRQVDQFWIGQKFNTGDSAPTQVSTDSLTMNLVSRFPGGIGYIQEGTPLTKNVKILTVIGQ